MNRVCRLLICTGLLSLLTACATQQYYADAVTSWQGAGEGKVYQTWGYPNKVMRLPNKHKVLVYHEEERGTLPIETTASTTEITVDADSMQEFVRHGGFISGGGSYDNQCTTWFELNEKGFVINARFRGNHCIATKDFMMRYRYQGF